MTGADRPDPEAELARLARRLRRETAARQEAELIAERGLRDLFQRQQEIALLENIAVAANEASKVGEAFAHGLAAVCRYAGWPLGHLWLQTERHGRRSFDSMPIWYDGSAEADGASKFAALRALTEASVFDDGIGLPSRVAESREPVWIKADEADAASFPRLPLVLQSGFGSLFAFPVKIGSEVVAVMEFFGLERQSPEPSMLRLMAQIGTQLGRVVERCRAQERLLHDALHDPLTQLGNRKLFLDRLSHLLRRSQRSPAHGFAVLFVDLDRFKAVNDALGHQCGDELIIATAQRLAACLRQTDLVARGPALGMDDLVARLGGDEFVILLDQVADAQGAIVVAERIMQVLAEPFGVQGHEVFVTASVGIALSASGYTDVEDILRDADIAMYHAKQAGRARWVMFDQAMQLAAVRRLTMEADLRGALHQDKLFLCYQPIVSPHDGMVTGFEALLRWRHPLHGLVPPAEFIPIAEETGLIHAIGSWVLAQACAQLCAWQRAHARPLSISVNVSAIQFGDGNLVETVKRVLAASGIAPASLKLELTESAVMADAEHALAVFAELKALGVGISLDDFGTGYSSLSYLRRLPIDTLKIDRSFVSQLDRQEDKRQIVEVVLTLARLLGLDVVAEGVETEAELDVLRDMGSDFVQGYFYYRPLPAEDVAAVLAAQDARAAA